MKKTIFITGTSSGLGKQTALHFASLGWNVAATMRSPEKETELTAHPDIKIFKLDVTVVEQVKAAVEQAIAAFGKIDVVVNNAGMGTYGALELADEKSIDWQFAVNVRGPINVIRAFLPHFRANQGGMFINISSLMGVTTALPIGSLYNMSKFALEGLTEGLYYELKPLNIKLRLVEQGGSEGNNFGENITWSAHSGITAYDEITEKVKSMMANADSSHKSDPQDIVEVIYELAAEQRDQFRTLVGPMAQSLVALRNTLPIEAYLDQISASFEN